MQTLLLRAVLLLLIISPVSYGQVQYDSTDSCIVIAKQFVEYMSRQEFENATEHFDATMKKVATPDKLRLLWESLVAKLGPYKKWTDIRKEKYGNYDFVFVTLEFEKSPIDFKIVFNRSREIAGHWIVSTQSKSKYLPPDYSRLNRFTETEVVIGEGEWKLPGTLSIPKGEGLFPAVILIHGSGPNDRDETIGPNKVFRDLAYGLASRQIAVLRYEKRTRQYSKKLMAIRERLTVKEETIDDAIAAVHFLRNHERIDPKRIFVIGHSLGGMLIPRIAKQDTSIAGFIIMAGPTQPLEDSFIRQVLYISSFKKNLTDEEKDRIDRIKEEVAQIKSLMPSDTSRIKKPLLGAMVKYWIDLKGYDPAKEAFKIKKPLLILQGERDYQVTMNDFNRWKKILSNRENVTFKSYQNLNHLFMPGRGKSKPSEYNTPNHVAKEIIKDISEWIKNH